MKQLLQILTFVIAVTFCSLSAQTSVTFSVNGIEAAPGGPWMFTYSSDRCTVPETFCSTYLGVYAYSTIRWNLNGFGNNENAGISCCSGATGSGVQTTTTCTSEITSVLSSTSGVTLVFTSFAMTGLQHTGVAKPNLGDRRIYSGATGAIVVNGTEKLKFTNSRMTFDVPYPSPCGSGGAITGNGWATIDPASDPTWKTEFDPYGTGQVEIVTTSFSPVVQSCYGTYNSTMTIRPVEHPENLTSGSVPTAGATLDITVPLTNANVSLRFTAAAFGNDKDGNPNSAFNTVVANQILNAPSGTLPSGVNKISQLYWQILTTLNSFTADITFDLARVAGISNPATLVILFRENGASDWAVVSSTLVDATHLKVSGATTFGDWAVGSTGGNALPVELQSFVAIQSGNGIILKWKTASEINSAGFTIERKSTDLNEMRLTPGGGLTEPAGWSAVTFIRSEGGSSKPASYSYTDHPSPGKYLYRLKQVDNNGMAEYSEEVNSEVALQASDFTLKQNFPNPFNPTTTIQFALQKPEKVTVTIYNMLGQEVTRVFNGQANAGVVYSILFNGSDFPSDTYLCVLEAGQRKETIKITLVK